MAIGALKGLREAGLRVPQDVALVGFDDVPAASVIEPTLTTVRQPIERLGCMAVEVLLSVLEGLPGEELLSVLEGLPEEEPSVHRIILPTELTVRVSCGSAW